MIKGGSKTFPLFNLFIGICNFQKGTVQSFKIWIDVKGSLKIMEKSCIILIYFYKLNKLYNQMFKGSA